MEHYAPHPSAKFEGWYSKFDIPSGAHIALIVCSVHNAPTRPHMVSFTYYPPSGDSIFQREHFVTAIEHVTTDPATKAFELRIPGLGYMRAAGDGTTDFNLHHAQEWSLEARTDACTAWRNDKATPEGWMIRLPLPLHWHVHSLCSTCHFQLSIPSLSLSAHGRATLHQEKNWAHSFPAAHMWVQAYDAQRKTGVCLAGGKILGQTAYMLGFRSPTLDLDFTPPFSISYFNVFSPFMSVHIDYPAGRFALTVQKWWSKVELKAHAPREKGWFGLAAPFEDGHRLDMCRESFLAEVSVRVYIRKGWWPWSTWEEVDSRKWEGGSLEFAGGYLGKKED